MSTGFRFTKFLANLAITPEQQKDAQIKYDSVAVLGFLESIYLEVYLS